MCGRVHVQCNPGLCATPPSRSCPGVVLPRNERLLPLQLCTHPHPLPSDPARHCIHAARRFRWAALRRIAEEAAFLSFLLPGLRRCLEAARSACPPRANPIRSARSACFRASLSIFSV